MMLRRPNQKKKKCFPLGNTLTHVSPRDAINTNFVSGFVDTKAINIIHSNSIHTYQTCNYYI